MTCNRAVADDWEEFTWVANADGTISLQGNNGLFVSSNNSTSAMTCDRATAQGWEDFYFGIVSTTASANTTATSALAKSFTDVTATTGVYPNPVRDEATVVYSLARESAVELAVYDVRGAKVRTLRSGVFGANRYQVRWDGRSDTGHRVPGGMYSVRLSAGNYHRTLKTAMMP